MTIRKIYMKIKIDCIATIFLHQIYIISTFRWGVPVFALFIVLKRIDYEHNFYDI